METSKSQDGLIRFQLPEIIIPNYPYMCKNIRKDTLGTYLGWGAVGRSTYVVPNNVKSETLLGVETLFKSGYRKYTALRTIP